MKRIEPKLFSSFVDDWLAEEEDLHEHLLEVALLEKLPIILKPYEKFIANYYLKDSVLTIKIRSSVVKEQLTMHKEQLKALLNKEVGVELIREIRLWS